MKKLTDTAEDSELDFGQVAVSAEVVEEVWQEGQSDDLLALPDYTFEEMSADLERDRLLDWSFGDHIPVVRTLPLEGSKCDVLVWNDTPRP